MIDQDPAASGAARDWIVVAVSAPRLRCVEIRVGKATRHHARVVARQSAPDRRRQLGAGVQIAEQDRSALVFGLQLDELEQSVDLARLLGFPGSGAWIGQAT